MFSRLPCHSSSLTSVPFHQLFSHSINPFMIKQISNRQSPTWTTKQHAYSHYRGCKTRFNRVYVVRFDYWTSSRSLSLQTRNIPLNLFSDSRPPALCYVQRYHHCCLYSRLLTCPCRQVGLEQQVTAHALIQQVKTWTLLDSMWDRARSPVCGTWLEAVAISRICGFTQPGLAPSHHVKHPVSVTTQLI